MKTTFTIAVTALALTLTACGGGSSDSGSLPTGKVGTVGDGVNQAEFDALQCGMNKDQVMAIVGDTPTTIQGDIVWNWITSTSHTQIGFASPTGTLNGKNTGPVGKPSTSSLKC